MDRREFLASVAASISAIEPPSHPNPQPPVKPVAPDLVEQLAEEVIAFEKSVTLPVYPYRMPHGVRISDMPPYLGKKLVRPLPVDPKVPLPKLEPLADAVRCGQDYRYTADLVDQVAKLLWKKRLAADDVPTASWLPRLVIFRDEQDPTKTQHLVSERIVAPWFEFDVDEVTLQLLGHLMIGPLVMADSVRKSPRFPKDCWITSPLQTFIKREFYVASVFFWVEVARPPRDSDMAWIRGAEGWVLPIPKDAAAHWPK